MAVKRRESSVKCEVCGGKSWRFIVVRVSPETAKALGSSDLIWKCPDDECNKQFFQLVQLADNKKGGCK